MLRDVPFLPSDRPSPGGVPVEQVIVAGDALAAAFQPLADREKARGIPTVVRTVSWIDANYTGSDRPARIRNFLRDAHDLWGTEFAVLAGDVETVPTRYVPWQDLEIPTDLYFECLDREWNEDGDAIFAEPLLVSNLAGFVNDVAPAADGALWIATNLGLTVLDAGAFALHDSLGGLPSNEVHQVSVAEDGTVWAATAGGVVAWDGASWTTHGTAEGLPSPAVLCIAARNADDVWAGTNQGIAHWDGAAWTTSTTADGLPSDTILDLALDPAGVWIATLQGAAFGAGAPFTTWTKANSGLRSNYVYAVARDGAGQVWFGHLGLFGGGGGYSRFDGTTWTSDGLMSSGSPTVRGFAFGPGADEMWMATPQGLLHRTPAGDELLDTLSGLPGADINTVALDGSGAVVVGGADGLSIGAPGAWSVYTEDNGLPVPPLVVDDIDLVPDLVVGRIPATDGAEAAAYLAKLFAYQDGLVTDHVESALFLGEVLFTGSDGKYVCENAVGTLPPNFTATELYEVDGTQDAATSLAAMTQGHGIVVHVGHGSYDVLGVGVDEELLYNGDMSGMDSGGRAGFYLGYNCNSGGFDQDCTMEHLLFNPVGGAIASTANVRPSVPSLDDYFNLDFLQGLFAGSHGNPALAFQEMRSRILAAGPDPLRMETWTRRAYLQRSFLGSPTLSLWRRSPQTLAVTHPASALATRSPFAVTVTDSATGVPVADALVCLLKDDEDYAYGRTDAAGAVQFDFRPETAGSLSVSVVAPDFRPYTASVPVTAPSGPHPVAESWERIAPGFARTGPADIRFSLRNSGAATGTGWTLTLVSEDPRVTVLLPTGTLGVVGPGQSGWTTTFPIDVAPTVLDGEKIPVRLTGTGASDFNEQFWIEASSTALTFDGIVTAGGDLFPVVTNHGSEATGTVTASLVALDATGTVIDGSSASAPVAPGTTVTLADGFLVSGDLAARYELTLDDGLGHVLVRTIDRQAPAGAAGAVSEPRDGAALVTWTRSPSADLAGYRVYGRTPSGLWQDELGSLVTGGARTEVPLAPGTSRHLLILAVDASGLESADSCFVTAHAAPPLLPGWPRRVSSLPGPSSVMAADLDGDGRREILHGVIWEANATHVFRADGTEWNDGDANPATHGIFGTTGGRVQSAPLALDIDGDGLRELFTGSYDGFLYGWRIDGPAGAPPTALPGFPVQVSTSSLRAAPVAADLDGDGTPEIVVVASYREVHAFETDGTPVAGWPRSTTSGGMNTTPAVFDLNGDGRDDIVFGANTDLTVNAWSGDGTDLPGWPVDVGVTVKSSPGLADVDGDGVPEIFVVAAEGQLHAFRADGSALPGWPVVLAAPVPGASPSPAFADFDGDDTPEIVVNGDGEIVILRADGTHYPGSPILTGAPGDCSPVIADLDGDGAFEILASTSDRLLHAYRPDGTEARGWPRRFSERPKSAPFVADVDGDGDLDVAIAADDGLVLVVDVAGPAEPGSAPWPGYHGGEAQDGLYEHVRYLPTGNPGGGPPPPPAPLAFRVDAAAPNPFRTGTEFRFALPQRQPVRLDILDVRGRRVANLLPGTPLPSGEHVAPWDGRDASGRPVAAGVYFYRFQAGRAVHTGKVLRLR